MIFKYTLSYQLALTVLEFAFNLSIFLLKCCGSFYYYICNYY